MATAKRITPEVIYEVTLEITDTEYRLLLAEDSDTEDEILDRIELAIADSIEGDGIEPQEVVLP